MTGPDGVRADWDELPRALAAEVKDLKFDSSKTYQVESGRAESVWWWTRKRGARPHRSGIRVRNRIRQRAAEAALDRLPKRRWWRSRTNRGPPVSAILDSEPQATVAGGDVGLPQRLRGDRQPGQRTRRRARRARHPALHGRASRVAPGGPPAPRQQDRRLTKVRSTSGTRSGCRLPCRPTCLPIRSRPSSPRLGDHKLDQLRRQPLVVTYRAEHPGQAHVDVSVMDKKTLLSPPLSVTVDVVPAR